MTRTGIGLAAVLLLAGIGWWQRDAWTDAWGALRARLPSAALPAAGGTPRRCNGSDGRTTYTDGACPPGTREQPLAGGSVSVLPAAPVAVPAASAASRPLLRRLAPDADGPTLKERMADRLP